MLRSNARVFESMRTMRATLGDVAQRSRDAM